MATWSEPVRLRPVCEADAGEIAEIYAPYVTGTTISFESVAPGEAEMARRIREIAGDNPWIVAESGGRIAGYAYAHPWKVRAAYSPTLETTVYLRPEAKGRGIGSLLMRQLVEECRRRGHHSLIACITADNAGSIAFHAALGFRQVSAFSEVGLKFGRWLDVVDMQLML